MTRMLGHDPEAVERQPLANIVAVPDRPALRVAIENALRSSSASHPVVQALRLLRRGGEEMISYELSIVSLVDDPTVGGLVVTAHDVSARVNAEMELPQYRPRTSRDLFTAQRDPGVDRRWAVGGRHRSNDLELQQSVRRDVAPPDKPRRRPQRPSAHRLRGGSTRRSRVLSRARQRPLRPARSREQRHARVRATGAYSNGCPSRSTSRAKSSVGCGASAISPNRSDWRTTSPISPSTTPSPACANRALFHDRVNQALARSERSEKYVAVVFLDLDNFKNINDSLGHSAGDDCFSVVASTLVGQPSKVRHRGASGR